MTRGGPNGAIQISCRPRSNAYVVRLVTILACVYLVHVSMTCGQGSFLDCRVGMSALAFLFWPG
eukprot:12918450-Prorocentrum_lima.AAC.1